MSAGPVRVLVLWSPDWPVTAAARAAHVPAHRPAAVLVANRVLACSAPARAQGVRRGLRRREAQARCPELAVLAADPDRDARAFEPVVVAIEELAPGVEVVRPGLVALPAQGPVGYLGGEQPAAERLVDQVAARTGVECQVGFADGLFAAVLAARRGVSVEPGRTREFLAPLEVVELDREPEVDRSELVGLLRRLGLRSLGAFGALDAADVASRFGADAVLAHRLARGLDPRPPVRRCPPEELAVELELDPPVDRVDAAAFAARGLAEQLHGELAGHGLSCTRLGITARTVAGEVLYRVWRCAEPLTPAGTVDRVRWQLDAWLTRRRAREPEQGSAGAGVDAGIRWLRLLPEETVTAGALQLGLWGEVGESDERAGRALVRVQALLGPESVVTGALVGGRGPAERVLLVPWGDERPMALEVSPSAPDAQPQLQLQPQAQPESQPEPPPQPPPQPALPGENSSAVPAVPAVPGSSRERASGRDPQPEPVPPIVAPEPVPPIVAPAGWPADVLRATGRVSPVAPDAADHPNHAGRFRLGRRRPPIVRRSPGTPGRPTVRDPPAPWPGRLPAPSPATVPPRPPPARLLDADGRPVRLAAPDLLSAPPHLITVDGGRRCEVRGWAGPWPVQQRWWTSDGVTGASMQVLCDDGTALLLFARDDRWWVTGVYD